MYRGVILFVIIGISSAAVLLTNGDFEQPLTTGWFQTASGPYTTINRATDYDPDPDYEAFVYKGILNGYARLYQVIDILDFPLTDLEFSVNTKLYAWDNHIIAWAGAAVVISYIDESDSLLGDTKICARSTQCPWTNTSTCHIIEPPDSLWHNYAFNINDELTNFTGINPSAIKKIEISLLATVGSHC